MLSCKNLFVLCMLLSSRLLFHLFFRARNCCFCLRFAFTRARFSFVFYMFLLTDHDFMQEFVRFFICCFRLQLRFHLFLFDSTQRAPFQARICCFFIGFGIGFLQIAYTCKENKYTYKIKFPWPKPSQNY